MSNGRGDGLAGPLGLLGCHVAGRAHNRAGLGQLAGHRAADPLGQAEVRDQRGPLVERRLGQAAQEDIRRFQVPVEDAPLVGIVHRAGDRRYQLRRGAGIGHEAPGMRREIAAVDQLHAEVMMPLVLADLVDRDDVGMVQMRRGLGFQAKPLEVVGRGEPPGPDHLQRQHAVQADLPGLEDDAHPAFRDDLDQLIIAEVADAPCRERWVVHLAACGVGHAEIPALSRRFHPDGLP